MKFNLDNNLDNENLNEIEALIIDVLSSLSVALNNKNSKAFFTSLGFVEKVEKMANNLAKRLFSYSLLTISNVSPHHTNSSHAIYNKIDINLFTYIASNRYSSGKFYGIMININTSIYFIVGYKQFMAYTRDIKDTTINITKVDIIYI